MKKVIPKKPPAKSPAPARPVSTAVATRPNNTAVAKAADIDLAADAGSGLGDMSLQDFAIPRLNLINDLSPAAKKREATYVDGAEPGMLINSVTNELFDGAEGVTAVLVSFRRTNIEWIPRKKGGGFVADHGESNAILSKCTQDKDTGAYILPGGNEIVPTLEYFIFVLKEDGEYERMVISFSKTQIKKARAMNSKLANLKVFTSAGNQVTPPIFYTPVIIRSTPEKNDKGSWFGFSLELSETALPDLDHGVEIYNAAREFRASVMKGDVKVAAPQSDGGHSTTNDEHAPM